MFKLQDLRTAKRAKWLAYSGFALIIISFIFFYGWQSNQQAEEIDLGRIRSGSLSPFKPWTHIRGAEYGPAEDLVVNLKASLLPPQLLQSLYGQRTLRNLVTRDEVIREAANQMLLDRKAREMGIDTEEKSILRQLAANPGVTLDQLRSWAAQSGFESLEDFLAHERRDQRIRRVQQLNGMLAHASLFELWQEYSLSQEKLSLQLAGYRAEDFESRVSVGDQELESYLNEHKEGFHVPRQRRWAYVALSRAELLETIQPTDEQLQAHYEQNQTDFKHEAGYRSEDIYWPKPATADAPTTLALEILTQTRAGDAVTSGTWSALVAELNAKYPELRFTRRESPGWLGENDTAVRPKPYLEALFTLNVDEISTPVADQNGNLFLIRALERREAGIPALEAIREDVLTNYRNDQIEGLFEENRKRWEEARKNQGSIREFAEAVAVDDKLTTMVDASNYNFNEIPANFSQDSEYIDGLKEGQMSQVIERDRRLIVLQLIQDVPAHDPPLAEIRNKIDQAVRRERALELAKAAAEQALTLLRSGAAFEQALADASIAPKETEKGTRGQYLQAISGRLLGFNEQSLQLAVGATGVSAYGLSEENARGYAVWKVLTLEEPDQKKFAAERLPFEREYLRFQGLAINMEWLADLRREADFTILGQ